MVSKTFCTSNPDDSSWGEGEFVTLYSALEVTLRYLPHPTN